jgi:dienelactone hydrolase
MAQQTPRTHAPRGATSGLSRLAEQLKRRRQAIAERPRMWAAISAIVVLLGGAIAWPFVKCHMQAAAVLDLVGNKPVPWLLRKAVAEPVETRDFALTTSNGPVPARLYVPVHHPDAPALVVLHGVHHLGMNEPRLVAFAAAMASCGIRVLTPELPDIKDYHVGPNSIATIGDSAVWMAEHNGGRSVGVMGLSFSGGLALLAAASPQYKPYIRFVVAIGSQDEMSRVAAYYRTGEDVRPDGSEELLPPHEYGALVMEYENVQDFVPGPDVAKLRAVLRAHLYENGEAEKAALAALSPAQLAEAKQLMDTTSTATRDALARDEAKHVEDMAGVSPHGHLHNLTTPVYLLHGEGDNIIPSAETQWMASELPSQTLQAELISPVLSHLNLDGKGPSVMDQLELVHFFALILHAGEAR